MFDPLRLYLRYAGIAYRGQMQYRASFLLKSVAQFLISGIEFLGIWALYDRFGGIAGWSLAEVAVLYGMVHCSFATAEIAVRGFDLPLFPNMVKQGEFDRILLRPRSAVLQLAGQHLHTIRFGRLLQGALVLAWGASHLGIAWTLPKAGLLGAALAGGTCLFCGLFIVGATFSFWAVESIEIMNCLTYGGVETAQFPISVYGPGLRALFTFVVPLATVNYIPAHVILGRPDALGSPVAVQWAAPVAGVLFLCAALVFWRIGVRHYTSTGS